MGLQKTKTSHHCVMVMVRKFCPHNRHFLFSFLSLILNLWTVSKFSLCTRWCQLLHISLHFRCHICLKKFWHFFIAICQDSLMMQRTDIFTLWCLFFDNYGNRLFHIYISAANLQKNCGFSINLLLKIFIFYVKKSLGRGWEMGEMGMMGMMGVDGSNGS